MQLLQQAMARLHGTDHRTGNRGTAGARAFTLKTWQRCLETYITAFDARKPFTMEYRLRRHDGKYRWVLDNGVPRFTADGTFSGYIGSCLDITDRRRAEVRLRQSEERFRRIVETALEGIWVLDPQGTDHLRQRPDGRDAGRSACGAAGAIGVRLHGPRGSSRW